MSDLYGLRGRSYSDWHKFDPELAARTELLPASDQLAMWHEKYPEELPIEFLKGVSPTAVEIILKRRPGHG